MAVTAISLYDPASGRAVVIKPRDGVAWQGFAFDGAARGEEEDRVSGHGSVDSTRFFTSAAVSLSVRLYANVRALLDEFSAMSMPNLRPVLVIDDDEWAQPRQVTLRFDSSAKPITLGTGLTRDLVLSWKAPAALWESAEATTAGITAFSASTTGIVISSAGLAVTSAGVIAPATSETPQARVINIGTAPADWTAQLYGPCSGPALSNDTTGGALQFSSSLVLDAGDYLLLDSSTHTAFINGDPAASALSRLNFTTSSWWQLNAGENLIRYAPSAASPGSEALIVWRSAWPP